MRNRIFFIVLLSLAFAAGAARADEKSRPASSDESAVLFKPAASSAPQPPARTTLFVVETDEKSAAESLNRIAGEIDKGFIYSDDAGYGRSDDQTRPGPFSRQEKEESR